MALINTGAIDRRYRRYNNIDFYNQSLKKI